MMLEDGEGMPPNQAKAVEWYRRAAEQGHAPAQLRLGVSLARGDGAPQDWKGSYYWLYLAATQESQAIEYRELVAKRLSPEEVRDVQAKASAWKPQIEISKAQ